jgi:hypothetical protein
VLELCYLDLLHGHLRLLAIQVQCVVVVVVDRLNRTSLGDWA